MNGPPASVAGGDGSGDGSGDGQGIGRQEQVGLGAVLVPL